MRPAQCGSHLSDHVRPIDPTSFSGTSSFVRGRAGSAVLMMEKMLALLKIGFFSFALGVSQSGIS